MLDPQETSFSAFGSRTTATYAGLADGSYTLYVKAHDQAGNEDPTPAARSFTVDTTSPETTIASGPTGTIAVTSATFTWSGSDNLTATGNLVYAFRLDPLEPSFSAFGSATSKTYTGLPNGNYTLYVKARDQAGHDDPTPAARTFTVRLGADLVQVAVSNPPATAVAGSKFQVEDTVQNQGGLSAGSSQHTVLPVQGSAEGSGRFAAEREPFGAHPSARGHLHQGRERGDPSVSVPRRLPHAVPVAMLLRMYGHRVLGRTIRRAPGIADVDVSGIDAAPRRERSSRQMEQNGSTATKATRRRGS